MDLRLRETIAASADTEEDSKSSRFAGPISLSLCGFNRFKKEVSNACGRVVLVNLASDLAPEQNTLMNLVFAAQQQGVKVDAVSLSGSVPILQQACDIASGSYFEVSESKKLFPMLMNHCLGNFQGMEAFNRKEAEFIDYR
ncbi:basic transcription factor 2 [Aphelenchoides avenae]|nr:basic transcription factor 2 [Aphelenchus avenae]